MTRKFSKRFVLNRFAAISLAMMAGLGMSAAQASEQPENVVSFQSSADIEVEQDQMRISLSTNLDGDSAQEVQERLRKTIEAALAQAKTKALPEKMEVTTGSFRINPRYGKDSKISGWQGYGELILEGTDFARITNMAAQIKELSMNHISFGLAPKTQRAAAEKAQSLAITTFKNRAQQLSQAFGFSTYQLREVHVNGNEYGAMVAPPSSAPRMKAMPMSSPMMEADSAIPAEPGKTRVEVSVNGSIKLK